MINMKRFTFTLFAIFSFSTSAFGEADLGAGTVLGAPLGGPPQLPRAADDSGRKNSQSSLGSAESNRQLAINKILLSTQQLFSQKKYDEALAKLQEADAIPNKSPEEKLLVDQTRIAIAASAGNNPLLASSIEAALASDKLPKETRIQYYETLTNINYYAKKFPDAILWASKYFQEDGKKPAIRDMLLRSYYFNGEYARAEQGVRAEIQEAETNGQKPDEAQLRLLTSCEIKMDNHAGYIDAIEKYVAYYPKKEYWTDLLSNILSKPGFPEYLTLDVYRLMQATGQLTTSKDYIDMAQLAMTSGYPAEAKKVLDEGFLSGVLGVGAEASKQKQLRDSATKATEREARLLNKKEQGAGKEKRGDYLIDEGFSYVDLGQYDKGIPLMEEGIRIGELKRAEEAKLHLGLAYMMANQKEKAIQAFKELRENSSATEIAKYWILFLNSPRQPAS